VDEPKFSPDFRRRFQHLELVGAGGTAVVYKAVQTSLDRVVAVKVLSPLAFTEEDSRRRFESERQLASQLKHANIITLLSFGEDSGRPFLVFEFVEGESLRVLIERHGRLEPARALAIAEEIAQALSAAHALGIIHRDLKPENVLIDSEGITKVFDFGLAQEARPDRVKLTSAGIVVGTPGYVAPELIQGEKATPCSDLYSLGIVLFEMLTGALPFPAQSEREMMLRYLKEDLPAVSSKGVEVPDYLDRIVAKLTRRNARGRPDDAQTVAAALERCRRKLSSAPRLARDGTLVEQRPEVDHGFDPLPTPVSRARSQTRVTAQFAKVKRGSLVALVLLVVLSAGLIRLFMSQAPQPVLVREVGPPRVIPGVTSASLQWETSGLAPTGIWLWEQDEKQALGITGKQEEPALVHQLTLTNLDREKHYDFRLQLPDNRRSTRPGATWPA
jgi:serine/threonine protein kinase